MLFVIYLIYIYCLLIVVYIVCYVLCVACCILYIYMSCCIMSHVTIVALLVYRTIQGHLSAQNSDRHFRFGSWLMGGWADGVWGFRLEPFRGSSHAGTDSYMERDSEILTPSGFDSPPLHRLEDQASCKHPLSIYRHL